jgi:geranylgeranyl reductase family protein
MTTTIIGAGPAGSFTAYKLAKRGILVNIVEEHNTIGMPLQCSGLVSENLKKTVDFPETLIINNINGAKFFFPNSEPIHFKGKAFVLDRTALDKFFYEKAVLAGAKPYLSERYESFEKGETYLKVKTNKRTLDSYMLVGADGPFSAVGKQIGVNNNCITGMQVRAKGEFDPETVELHFGSNYPGFFAWMVPESKDIARIGVAGKENLVENFKKFLKLKNVTKAIDQQGGTIPIDHHSNIVADRVALVGDAASQTKATTGGGITTGIESAKILARAISKCYTDEDFSKESLQDTYVKHWKRGIGSELKKAYFIRKSFDLMTDNDFTELGNVMNDDDFKQNLEKSVDLEMYSKFILKSALHPKMLGFLVGLGLRKPALFKNVFGMLF